MERPCGVPKPLLCPLSSPSEPPCRRLTRLAICQSNSRRALTMPSPRCAAAISWPLLSAHKDSSISPASGASALASAEAEAAVMGQARDRRGEGDQGKRATRQGPSEWHGSQMLVMHPASTQRPSAATRSPPPSPALPAPPAPRPPRTQRRVAAQRLVLGLELGALLQQLVVQALHLGVQPRLRLGALAVVQRGLCRQEAVQGAAVGGRQYMGGGTWETAVGRAPKAGGRWFRWMGGRRRGTLQHTHTRAHSRTHA